MDLDLKNRNKLINALMQAFLDEPKLGTMLNRELDIELNSIVQNASDYEETIVKLVTWAQSEGRVLELVVGASRRNPGNRRLQSFILDNLLFLLDNSFEPIALELVLGLANILGKVDQSKPILDSLFEVKGIDRIDLEIHKEEENIDFLLKGEELNALKIYLIFDILKTYPYGDDSDWPNVLKFAKNICDKPLVDDLIQDLNDWIQKVLNLCGFENPTVEVDASDDSCVALRNDSTDVALMVMISERKLEGKDDLCDCCLQACVQAYKTENGRSRILCPVDVDFSDVSSLEGKPCTFASLDKEVKALIDKTIIKMFNAFTMPPDLSVEVFLPLKWMAAAVDLWMTGEFKERMGGQYRVAIRSYERNFRPQLKFSFWQFWNNTYEPLLQKEIQVKELHKHHIAHVKAACDVLDARILKKKIALKMTSPPPQKQSEQFFLPLIRADIPFAIWTRCESVPSMKQEEWHSALDGFFDWHTLKNPMVLLDQVRQRREEAHLLPDPTGDLGYHLSVLCDDPYRVPEKSLLDER